MKSKKIRNILQLLLGCVYRSKATVARLLGNRSRIVSVIALLLLFIAIVAPVASAGFWDWSSSAKTSYDSWYIKYAKISAALLVLLFIIVGTITIGGGLIYGFNKAIEGLLDHIKVLLLFGVFLGVVTILLLAAEALSGL
ncbi:hypothetical protein L6260_04025 [Candidatus Parcubacteria bacterium]|nr:hypothetical protein [Candidatus Parcubacteria bacterium]